jgi:(p)ppGpp synthase/HD superfamily hydrolase
MNLIEQSLKIALEAHAGQKDKAGWPYVLHPIRMMLKMDSEIGMAAALLHDVLEDSNFTAETLREEGIPPEVVEAVLCLTRQENEPYEDFIERAAKNPIARKVKKADLEDNIDLLRLREIRDRDVERLKKYHIAWNRIKSVPAEKGEA